MREAVGRLADALDGVPPDRFAEAVAREADRRTRAFVAAVERYRRHPARRVAPDPPAVWQEGTTRLLDYGPAGAPAALVVPSLINRHYVLDLSPERSFVATLRSCGLRPLVVDWGVPGAVERGFGLDGYIVGRLEPALDAACRLGGGPVGLIGYCMGGLLALALALRRRAAVGALALLGTPWDFHAGQPPVTRLAGPALAAVEPLLSAFGELPVDVLQSFFFALDPWRVIDEFLRFGALDPRSAQAAAFVLLEDWLNDGVPLAAPVARECIAGWYVENRPAHGRWRVAGAAVDPSALAAPTLVVIPDRDRIVPPPSAAALAAAIPGARRLAPAAGHIGMVAGRAAPRTVAAPLADWMLAALRAGPCKPVPRCL